jgi:hypothetical protein
MSLSVLVHSVYIKEVHIVYRPIELKQYNIMAVHLNYTELKCKLWQQEVYNHQMGHL